MVQKLPEKVRFHYLKSAHFRVIHADGALGGITPRGLIHFAIYSERPAIPQAMTHKISDKGELTNPPTDIEGRDGIVRELDVDVLMTKNTAVELRDWLSERINDLEKLEKASSSETHNA